MNSTAIFNAEQLDKSIRVLDTFLATSAEFVSALITTVDGRHILSRTRLELFDSRVSAMTGSMLALSETLSSELQMQTCNHVTITTNIGVIVVMRIDDPEHVLVLTTVARNGASLGALLASSRKAVAYLNIISSIN